MHSVQFYESEEFLFAAVADFLGAGLREGHPAIVIATALHCEAFGSSLKDRGIDEGRVVYADARAMLSAFMKNGMPDPAAFKDSVGGLIAGSRSGNGQSLRAYGEMVDLLWRDANPEAAIRLEELWNDLLSESPCSLLCAYPMGNFYKEAHGGAFERICLAHSAVNPAESYVTLAGDDDAKAREISILQQRAAALAAEVEHRQELEQALRNALAARRDAEDALRRSQRDLQDFVEHATTALHWVAGDGTILWANEAELELLGYPREEYVGRNIVDFHVDREVIEDIVRRLVAGEKIEDRAARMRANDGSIRWVEISSSALLEDGEFKHTRCFTRDVTDRKRLEAERRRIDDANAFLLEAAHLLDRSLDYETRLSELARLVVPRLADWCAVDLVRDDGAAERVTVAGESDFRPDDSAIRAVVRSGEGQIADAGTYSAMIVPMRHTSGVVGTVSVVSKSARRRYNDDDRVLITELARRAAVAIENARLYRFAQQANRAKDEFLATLSHELRTPLTAILGWARMLRMGGIDAETQALALETIERSARTQASLIDDILDLSRVVTGKIALQSELVDLTDIVNNTIETVRMAASAKDIRVNFVRAPQPAFVTGDPTRLQQIVWNLLANAIKFSPAGSTVDISLKGTRDVARIIVRDHGVGIRPDFLPHVFEPFRQAEASTTRAFGGLGLGLAIVKYFVELHGGTVAAESAGEGSGSRFTISLPLATRVSSSMDDDPTPLAAADLRGTSVLVVDDDDDTRIVITAALRNCGADVRSAASVAQACRLFDQKAPDVVVTDIAMPGTDGFVLIDYIRTRGDGVAKIPAIALTALGLPLDEERALGAGFNAFARKPVEPLQFANVVAQFRRASH